MSNNKPSQPYSTESFISGSKRRVTLEELWIYPVKSFGGISLQTSELTPAGLMHDRRWMVVDEQGQFVSQRKLPQMAQFKVSFPKALNKSKNLSGEFVVHAPTGETCRLSPDECQTPCQVIVWQQPCQGLVASAEVNAWLNRNLLGDEHVDRYRLVYFDPTSQRKLAQDRFGLGSTGFADAAPFLVASNESLACFNKALVTQGVDTPLSMSRFRPNIVISGLPAFAEHQLSCITFDSVSLAMVDHCQRCSMITVNANMGQYQDAKKVFGVLSSLNPMPDNAKAPAFGVNTVLNTASIKPTLKTGTAGWAS